MTDTQVASKWRELLSPCQAEAVKAMEARGWNVADLDRGDVLMLPPTHNRSTPFVRVRYDGFAQPFHRGRRIGYLWGVAVPCSPVAL